MTTKPQSPPLPTPRRLLVRGVNWLGDAVMTTPALLRLRAALPETHIALLTAAKLADLWRGHAAIDDVLTFAPGEGPWTVGRRLRSGGYDAALVLPNSPRSVFECVFARIPVRVGYARSWRGGWLTRRVRERPQAVRMRKPSLREIRARLEEAASGHSRMGATPWPIEAHHCHEYLTLVTAFGASSEVLAPRLDLAEAERAALVSRFGLDASTRWLGLNPGAEYGPAKRWPADRFGAVAGRVSAEVPGIRWVILGGPGDRAVAGTLAAMLPGAVDLAGRTTLRELMAVLASCRLVLTNDTGPMHVAAALGVPVVVPFGSTSPELTGPGMPGAPRRPWLRVGAPCAPCFLRECPVDFRCMLGIGVDRVVAEIREAL